MTQASGGRVLAGALVLLAVLYAAWFGTQPRPWVALAVFAAPPLLLALAHWRGRGRAAFWAGVLALAWFSHGVVVAWTRPAERGFALAAIALAVAVVVASSWPGLRARFGGRGRGAPPPPGL